MPIEEVTPDNPRFIVPKQRTISLRWLLALVFGTLLTLSVGGVIAVSVGANVANTFALLRDSSVSLLTGIENTLRDQINQAELVVKSTSDIYREGGFELGNMGQQEIYLKSLIRAAPIVDGLLVFDLNGQKTGMLRLSNGDFIKFYGNKPESKKILDAFKVTADRKSNTAMHSSTVLYHGKNYQAITYSLKRNKKTVGVAVALIGTRAINKALAQIGTDNDTQVFLMDNNSNVIAYSKTPHLFADRESIPLAQFPDVALRNLLNARTPDEFQFSKNSGVEVKLTEKRDEQVYLLKKIVNNGKLNFILGANTRIWAN